MGRDNQPKERQRQQLARKEGRRVSHDRILIVSEGRKTEPNYFQEIRSHYRLHAASVEVRPSEWGTSPLQVVEYTRELFENGDPHKKIRARAFEQIHAVFDRDDHDSYFLALERAKSLDGKLRNDNKAPVSFQAIPSVPCFELWLLLHYEDIQAPLHRNTVVSRLKRWIPDYEKGATGIFATTRNKLGTAMQRAKELAKRFDARSEPEPFTAVDVLVTRLTNPHV